MVASIHLHVPCSSFHPAGLAPWLVSFIPFPWFLAPSPVLHILPVYLLDLSLFFTPCLGPPSQHVLASLPASVSLWVLSPYAAQPWPLSFLPLGSSPGPGVAVRERPPGPEEAAGGGPNISVFAYA